MSRGLVVVVVGGLVVVVVGGLVVVVVGGLVVVVVGGLVVGVAAGLVVGVAAGLVVGVAAGLVVFELLLEDPSAEPVFSEDFLTVVAVARGIGLDDPGVEGVSGDAGGVEFGVEEDRTELAVALSSGIDSLDRLARGTSN